MFFRGILHASRKAYNDVHGALALTSSDACGREKNVAGISRGVHRFRGFVEGMASFRSCADDWMKVYWCTSTCGELS